MDIKKAKWISVFALLSLLGMYIHNSDLPLDLLSPENSIPTLITLLLLLFWILSPVKPITLNLFLGWAILNLAGGILSAIPFDFWSLGQLQTFEHLVKHAIYALAQCPLIYLLFKLKQNN